MIVLLVFAGQSIGIAASQPLELKWSELAPMLSGRTVEFTSTNGISIRGEVAAVREDSLLIDVKRTSDPKTYPKGNATVPKTSLTVLTLERPRSSWGRTMGTTLGVLTGLTVGGYVAGTTADSASTGIPIFLRDRFGDRARRVLPRQDGGHQGDGDSDRALSSLLKRPARRLKDSRAKACATFDQ